MATRWEGELGRRQDEELGSRGWVGELEEGRCEEWGEGGQGQRGGGGREGEGMTVTGKPFEPYLPLRPGPRIR